jgi:hypothetical protein
VAMRSCPICFARISAGKIAAYTNDLECPNCKMPLEVALGSRTISIFAGLAAAVLVWLLTQDSGSALDWVLPLVYAFLALSVVSTVVLMLVADLRVRIPEAVAATEHAIESAPAHASPHH